MVNLLYKNSLNKIKFVYYKLYVSTVVYWYYSNNITEQIKICIIIKMIIYMCFKFKLSIRQYILC